MGSSPTGGTKCLYGGMVDTTVLETVPERGVGSSPTMGTYKKFYVFVSSRINYYICTRIYFYERTNIKTLV